MESNKRIAKGFEALCDRARRANFDPGWHDNALSTDDGTSLDPDRKEVGVHCECLVKNLAFKYFKRNKVKL